MKEINNELDFIKYIVEEDNNGLRIDKVLANLNSNLSRTQIQSLIDEGFVLCNDKNVKASLKVFVGDEIKLFEKEIEECDIVPENIPLDIIYEDDDIIIVNKPEIASEM